MSCWKELRTCLNRWDLILEQSLPSTSWYCNSHTEGEKDFQNMLTKQLYPSIAPCACYFQSAALLLLHVCHDGSPVCAQSSTEWLYPKSMVTWLVTTLWMLNSAANKPLSVSYPFISGTTTVTVGVDAKSEVLFSQVGVNSYCLLVSI